MAQPKAAPQRVQVLMRAPVRLPVREVSLPFVV
jgi:hypothetical protein